MAGRLAVAISLLSAVGVIAQADPWYGRSRNAKDFVPANMPWNTIALELHKEWQLVPGRAGILFTATEKTRNNRPGAAIVLEQQKLRFALAPEQIDADFARYEADEARDNDPASTPVSHEVKDVDGRRLVLVVYTRPGFAGTDTVVQYTFVHGDVKFRVVGIAPTTQLPKYQPIFAHVAATFRDTGLVRPAGQ